MWCKNCGCGVIALGNNCPVCGTELIIAEIATVGSLPAQNKIPSADLMEIACQTANDMGKMIQARRAQLQIDLEYLIQKYNDLSIFEVIGILRISTAQMEFDYLNELNQPNPT